MRVVAAKPTILVVEDDLSWQMIYRELFEDAGYSVQVAGSRDEADHLLESADFDVAIIDLRLVDEDPGNTEGLKVVRALRRRDSPTRVIVQSGYLTAQVRQELESEGAFAILEKGGPMRQLMESVAEAINEDLGRRRPLLERDAD
jgi:DNA-binding NtrC family response regulator